MSPMSGHRIASALILSLCFLTASGRWSTRAGGPTYEVDPAWPKPLPNHWILGAVAGVAVDAATTSGSFIVPRRFNRTRPDPNWRGAPPVLEFDRRQAARHGAGRGRLRVAAFRARDLRGREDRVWMGGAGDKDAHILKFTRTASS